MKVKHWIIKTVILTILLAAGFSLISEIFISNMSIIAAVFILLAFIAVGIIFDIIGVAVATCDEAPIVAMCAKKVKNAKYALPLVKNAEMVANICNDVIGDICGVISGSAGAAITLKVIVDSGEMSELIVSIIISTAISVATIAGKANGKKIAMSKNKEIVMAVGGIINFLKFGKSDEKKN
jgi:hypothetical protein